jgi:hypothetical protein
VAAEPAEDEPPCDRSPDDQRSEVGGPGEAGLGVDAEAAAAIEDPFWRAEEPPAAVTDGDAGAEGEERGGPVEDGSGEFGPGRSGPGGLGVADMVRETDGRFEGGTETGADAAVAGEPGGERGAAPDDAGHPGHDEDDGDEELLTEGVDGSGWR